MDHLTSDTFDYANLLDSQPLFNGEEEEDLTQGRKRNLTPETDESQSLLAPKKKKNSASFKKNILTVQQNQETQTSQEDTDLPNQNVESEDEKYECMFCNKTRISFEKDFRNEHYGKLVSSELQFVEPCMRTFVFVEILKLIHRNKYGHMPINDANIK